MKAYHDLLRHIQAHGTVKNDRTGTGTISTFGYQMRFDLSEGFPVLTTKRLHLRSIIHELLWFLQRRYEHRLPARERRDDLGRMGRRRRQSGPRIRKPVAQLAGADGRHIDQIAQVVDQIERNPDSRRLIVSAWNVARSTAWRFRRATRCSSSTSPTDGLSCQLYQRSADVFLGVPFNIASYALLTMMIAQVTGLVPASSSTRSAMRTSI